MKHALAVLALAVTSYAAPAQAQSAAQSSVSGGVGYQCKVATAARQGNWIPEFVFIGYKPAENLVIISDPIILYFNDRQPVEGRLETDSASRISVTWRLDGKSGSGQFVRMAYRATVFKATGKLTISAKPLGYEDSFNGNGTCEMRKLS